MFLLAVNAENKKFIKLYVVREKHGIQLLNVILVRSLAIKFTNVKQLNVRDAIKLDTAVMSVKERRKNNDEALLNVSLNLINKISVL